MKLIDLHVHSNVSDGTLTPTEVVKRGIEKELAAFALTDHDTIEGIHEACEAAAKWSRQGKNIQVLSGVELSAGHKTKDIHILGLLIDEKNQILCASLEAAQKEREQRNIKMAENLATTGIPISIDKLRNGQKNPVLTRAHFAKYLKEQGYVKTTGDAFIKYLNTDGPYYVPRKYITPEKAIETIRIAGGIPVLAHPLLYHLPPNELKKLISQLKDMGLMGIEAIHSSNVSNDEAYIKGLARKYELCITGGSDFHGANKPLIDMGVGKGNLKIPYEILERLEVRKKEVL